MRHINKALIGLVGIFLLIAVYVALSGPVAVLWAHDWISEDAYSFYNFPLATLADSCQAFETVWMRYLIRWVDAFPNGASPPPY